MEINIDYTAVKTVKENYRWDDGSPDASLVEDAFTDTFEYKCYAPYANVKVSTSARDFHPYTIITQRKIDFGDYYNAETNVQTTPTTGSHIFYHNYIMPGEYTIKVTQTEYIRTNNVCVDNQPICSDPNLTVPHDLYAEFAFEKKERLPYTWMWEELTEEQDNDFFGSLDDATCLTWEDCEFQGRSQTTWEDAEGPCFITRNKDTSWQWRYVVQNPDLRLQHYSQNVTWADTIFNGVLPRTWRDLSLNCFELVPKLSAHSVTTTYEQKIIVSETPPEAYLTVVSILTGEECLVRLSPKFTQAGSFPIEKIIWNLGDGTPNVEYSRLNDSIDNMFVFNGTFLRDKKDPRNYDVVYKYYRNFAKESCFYPSITAISSSTFSCDQAATVVGPVLLKTISSEVDIIQTQLTEEGKAYVGQINRQLVFWKSKPVQLNKPAPVKTTPKSYIELINRRNKFVLDINTGKKLTLIDSDG